MRRCLLVLLLAAGGAQSQSLLAPWAGPGSAPMPPWRALLSECDARWIADRLQQGNLP